MHRSWLLTLTCTQAALCLLLSAAGVPAAEGANNQVHDALLNNELPFPDSFFSQSVKPVIARLKGQVTSSRQAAQSKANPATISNQPDGATALVTAVPTSPMPQAITPPSAVPTTTPAAAKESLAPDVVAAVPATPAPLAVAFPPATAFSALVQGSSPFSQQLNDLLAAAQKQNPEWQQYVDAVERYGDWKRRLVERTHDMLNYSVMFKGVSPSSEGGDVILGEKSKLKSLASAKYMRQRLADGAELQLTSATMQLAGGLGNQDANEGQSQISESMQEITLLAGKEAADGTMALFKQWQAKDSVSATRAPIVNQPLWTVADGKTHVEEAVAAAAMSDPVIADIRADVHHYNQHSKGTMAAHRIARTALNVASLTPNLVGPAAQVVLFAYITVSGGTEQEKLLRELYIDKRLGSRVDLLGEQAHMALYNYQLGALTQNNLLMECSGQLLTRLCGTQTANKLLNPAAQVVQAGDKQSVSTRP